LIWPYKYRMSLRARALLRAAWLVSMGCPRVLFSAEVTVLQPAGSFELPADGSYRLRDVTASSSSVLFLLQSRRDGLVITTDAQGRVLSRTTVSAGAQQIAARESDVVVLRNESSGSLLATIASVKVIEERQLSGAVRTVAFANGGLVGLTDTHLVIGPGSTPASPTPLGILYPNRIATTSNGRVAIVASQHPTLWFLDNGRISPGIPLLAPELKSVSPEPGELIVYGVASHSSGDIFCAIAPYRGDEGARILRFDQTGRLKQRVRLVMPEFPETRGHGDGRLSATHIALVGDRLFVASRTLTTNRCAFYNVPPE
jgi:hypothetical protein